MRGDLVDNCWDLECECLCEVFKGEEGIDREIPLNILEVYYVDI